MQARDIDVFDGFAAPAIPTVTGAASLTPREGVIAELVARGATNKQAAQILSVSPKTVEFHLSKVFRKLGVASRSQLAWLIARAHRDRSDGSVESARANMSHGGMS